MVDDARADGQGSLGQGSLRRAVLRAEAMADAHPGMLWAGDTGETRTAFNRAWLAFTGRTREQEAGDGWLRGVHPDDRRDLVGVLRRHAGSAPFEAEYRLRRSDGAWRRVRDAGRPWADGADPAGLVGCCLEVARAPGGGPAGGTPAPAAPADAPHALRRAAEQALQEGILVTDAEGCVVSVNAAAERLLGVTASGVVGRPLAETAGRLRAVDADGVELPAHRRPYSVVLATGRPVLGITLGWSPDGGPLRWHAVNVFPLHATDGGRATAVVTSFLDVTEHKQAADEARRRARYDDLTGVPNRTGLLEQIRGVAARTRRAGTDIAVAFCDVDDLKRVNDTLGHAAGDLLLREVSDRITASVRSGDVVARVGGDEFVVILDAVAGRTGALLAAEKVRWAVRRPLELRGSTFRPTISVGVALLQSVDDLDASLDRADAAMYRAKRDGRDRSVVHTDG